MQKKNKRKRKFIVFGKPYWKNAEIKELIDTIKSGWWGTGPKTELFEEKFKDYIGCKYALGVNSATAGLHLSLVSLGVKEDDEVITTPMTFCSTVNAIMHVGAKPIFVDINPDTWNIDETKIEKKITKKTKAIMPVHLHGRPCNMDIITKLAKKHNLFVIEDAAHAIEASYKKKKIGNISDSTVFSFYATKNLATGEGGMITTNNKNLIDKMRVLSLHGLSKDAYKRYSVTNFRIYECLYPGYKYNLTDIASSLGIHQLARLKSNAKIREKYWKIYQKGFSDMPLIKTPSPIEKDSIHARHLFAILLPLEKMRISRTKFISALISKGVGSGIHFTPVHLHSYYKKTFGYKRGDFPNSEYIGERTISLPLGANLKEKDVLYIINTVKKLVQTNLI